METLAVPVMVIGVIICFIGSIMLLVASFQVSIWWGLAVLFLPFAELFFLIIHWYEAKHSVKIWAVGCVITLGGVIMDNHEELLDLPKNVRSSLNR